jgi:amino acid transporter
VAELARDLGLLDITMVGVGAMIGAGIFALTGIAAGVAGPGLIAVFCLNGILTMCTAMVYAEMGSAIPGAGGGYLWVRFGLPGPCAFLSGWLDWLAHAVAGSLYAVVFGVYVVWGLQTIVGLGIPPTGEHGGGLGTLFGIDATWFAKGLTLMICMVFVWINYRGSRETGKAGNIITMAKVIIIGIFLVFGVVAMIRGTTPFPDTDPISLGEKFTPLLPMGFNGIFVAMGLTFIAFEGYEIIVQAGEEVVDPRRNIPRAVFLSLLIVIPIYILVAIVCLGALVVPPDIIASSTWQANGWGGGETWRYLSGLGETGVAEAAKQFIPFGLGAIMLVVAAVLSTMSALNATTYSSTRVSFAMGRDRYLPSVMSRISPRTRVPSVALLCSGVLITIIALTLDVEQVAAATCVFFLLVFAAVNISAITIRRKYGDRLEYGYRAPGFPYVPIIAATGQLAIAVFLFIELPVSLWLTIGWVSLGLIIYYTWSRRQEHGYRASPVVFEQRAMAIEGREIVLVPVANPANADALVDLASRLVDPEHGGVLILHVVAIPEQLPLTASGKFIRQGRSVVDAGLEIVQRRNIPSSGLIRVSRSPSQSIADTVQERSVQTVVLGWAGPGRRRAVGTTRTSAFGAQVDDVLRSTDANTVLIKGRLPASINTITIPVANPKQASYAIHVAEQLGADGARINLLHVVGRGQDAEASGHAIMEELFGAPQPVVGIGTRNQIVTMTSVIHHRVVQAILDHATDADLLIVGAAGETWIQRRPFTSLHYSVASRFDRPMLLVKMRSGAARFAMHQAVDFFTSPEPAE